MSLPNFFPVSRSQDQQPQKEKGHAEGQMAPARQEGVNTGIARPQPPVNLWNSVWTGNVPIWLQPP